MVLQRTRTRRARGYGLHNRRISVIPRMLDGEGNVVIPETWDVSNPVINTYAQLISTSGQRPFFDQAEHNLTQRTYRIPFNDGVAVGQGVLDSSGAIREITAVEEVGYRDRLDLIVEGTDVSN